MNLRNLERVLAREEEVKKKAIVHKAVYKGPQIRYLSKDGKLCSKIVIQSSRIFPEKQELYLFKLLPLLAGCNYLEFCNGASFNSELSTKSIPCK